jgi:hypothetical protein
MSDSDIRVPRHMQGSILDLCGVGCCVILENEVHQYACPVQQSLRPWKTLVGNQEPMCEEHARQCIVNGIIGECLISIALVPAGCPSSGVP